MKKLENIQDKKAETPKKKTSSSKQLLIVFMTLFLALIGSLATLYFYSLNEISNLAVEVRNKTIDADASSTQVSSLQALKSQLDNDRSLIEKTNSIFSNSNDYQAQVVKDIQNYSRLSNIQNTTINFNGSNSSENYRLFNVQIPQPVEYSNFVKFLNAIENNIPKMEASGVKIERANNPDFVNVNNFSVKIYIK